MSDDHPTFMYRLTMLKENFPNIPFYGTLWNGGTDERDFFATGALNVFLLFSPLIYSFPITSIYNLIITLLLFVFFPFSVFLAARLQKFDHLSALLASVLAISASFTWYRWALQYGTLGFVTSCSLMPLNIALAARYFQSESIQRPIIWLFATLASFSLMLLWTPSGLVFIPVILLGLCYLRNLLRHRSFIVLALLMVCIHLPWIGLFWSVSKVNTFLTPETIPQSLVIVDDDKYEEERVSIPKAKIEIDLDYATEILRKAASSSNFLLFLLTLPGLILFRPHLSKIYLSLLLWLPLLACVIGPLKPQLELERMLVVMAVIAALPAAKGLGSLYHTTRNKLGYLVLAITFGFLITGIFGAASTVRGRNFIPLYYQQDYVFELVRDLPELSRGGRLLFSGFVLHELNQGHIAPLASWSGVPMIASSQVHNLWYYKQVFPMEVIDGGESAREEYLDIFNVSLVAAHEPYWIKKFRKDSRYTSIKKYGKFWIFARDNFPESYIYSGQANITAIKNSSIELKAMSPKIVLRYRYFPWLTSNLCSIRPYRASFDVELIELRNCPVGSDVKIQSVSPLTRLKLESAVE